MQSTIKGLMDGESLRQFYPLNLLDSKALEALAHGISILEYTDEDYVFRLGEDLKDLFYVLEGSVQVMDIENRSNEVLLHDTPAAQKPFTHDVPAGAVAVAKVRTRVLKVDYPLLCSLLPSGAEALRAIRPGRQAKVEDAPVSTASAEPEYLEMPEGVDKNIQLLQSSGKSFSRRKMAEAAAKQVPAKAETPSVAAANKSDVAKRKRAEKPVKTTAAAPTRPQAAAQPRQMQPARKPALQKQRTVSDAKALSRVFSDLGVLLTSEIKLESKSRPAPSGASSGKIEQKPARKVKPLSLYDDEVNPNSPPEAASATPRRKTMSDLLSSTREILYSDVDLTGLFSGAKEVLTSEIKLQPKNRSQAQSGEDDIVPTEAVNNQLSDAEYRDIETREYLRAMSLYRKQDWASAHAAFRALYAANPRTNLYRTYAARCQESMSRPSA